MLKAKATPLILHFSHSFSPKQVYLKLLLSILILSPSTPLLLLVNLIPKMLHFIHKWVQKIGISPVQDLSCNPCWEEVPKFLGTVRSCIGERGKRLSSHRTANVKVDQSLSWCFLLQTSLNLSSNLLIAQPALSALRAGCDVNPEQSSIPQVAQVLISLLYFCLFVFSLTTSRLIL